MTFQSEKSNLKKIGVLFCFILVLVFLISACFVRVSDAPQSTPTITNALPITLPNATDTTNQNRIGNPSLPTTTIPVSWSNLNLSGKLIYTSAVQESNGNPILSIHSLDLLTGVITTVFQGSDLGWIYYVSVSPDEKQLVMSYSVPQQSQSLVNPLLYVLPLDGSAAPQFLVLPPSIYDQYNQAEWSPDGKYIYYVHNNYQNQPIDQHYPHYEILRMTYPNGMPEKVADQAFWPRLSADGSQLVYISMDPMTGKNNILVANADGTNAQPVVLSGSWTPDIIDAPIFSPDGGSIIFSALSPQQTSAPTWIEKLFGIQVAEAHMIPSDWWSVPITGGVVTRLTNLRTTALFASFSLDQRVIASYSGGGLFVMNPDGTNLTMLIPDMGGIPGTVSWLP